MPETKKNPLELALAKMAEKLYPNFYGSITFHFQAGKFQTLKIEETWRPD